MPAISYRSVTFRLTSTFFFLLSLAILGLAFVFLSPGARAVDGNGTIIVKKITEPAGDTTKHTFTGALTAQLSHNETAQVTVASGAYVVTEIPASGWFLSDVVCDDGASAMPSTRSGSTVTYRIEADEQVTCTFKNTKKGKIVVKKRTNPVSTGTGALFSFSGAITTSLMDGGTATGEVVPGTYAVEESVPEGWTLVGVDCDDGTSEHPSTLSGATVTYKVEAGETVTCTFKNVKRGRVRIEKETVDGFGRFHFTGQKQPPQGEPSSFFDVFLETSLQQNPVMSSFFDVFFDVFAPAPIPIEIVELQLGSWDLTDVQCSDSRAVPPNPLLQEQGPSNEQQIELQPGSDIICHFENTKAICGNGVLQSGEQCDDGNNTNGDGCNSQCVIEFCGDGTVQAGLSEECDDGNTVNGDGCSALCKEEIPSELACNGKRATIYVQNGKIVGGPQNGQTYVGILTGTNGNDVMIGTNRPDLIRGLRGDDTICGRSAPDTLKGDAGNDWINGEEGSDVIEGNEQDDVLIGSTGNDAMFGNAGADTLCAGLSGDVANGGDGNDAIDGGLGTDVLNGQSGTDACYRGEVHTSCESIITTALPACAGF